MPATLAANFPNMDIRDVFDAGTFRPWIEGCLDVVKLATLFGYIALLYGGCGKHGSQSR